MAVPELDRKCPHCGCRLKPFRMPDGAGWDDKVQWACFNDDCPYYREGWEWMQQQYAARTSYRFRITGPDDTKGSPIPVNSERMLTDLIIDEGGG